MFKFIYSLKFIYLVECVEIIFYGFSLLFFGFSVSWPMIQAKMTRIHKTVERAGQQKHKKC